MQGIRKSVAVVVLLAMAGVMTGCWGVHAARDDGQSTAVFRFDTEVIDNAELVRERTMPEWPLGRHAFQRGADRMLVLTRITRVSDKDEEGQPIGTPYDKIWERAWISIPLGTPVGKEVRLEDLERDFLLGYDEMRLEGGAYFIQPYRIQGTVRIVEERPDSVVVDLDVMVEPKALPTWRVRESGRVVPLTSTGIHASMTQQEIAPLRRPSTEVNPVGSVLAPPQAQPAQPEQPADNQPTAERIVGKWFGATHERDYRLQIDEDKTFVFAACRGNGQYPTMMRFGTYEFKGGFLLLHVTRMAQENDFSEFAKSGYPDNPVDSFQITFEGDKMVIDGRERVAGMLRRITLSRDEYPDMNKVLPPRRK